MRLFFGLCSVALIVVVPFVPRFKVGQTFCRGPIRRPRPAHARRTTLAPLLRLEDALIARSRQGDIPLLRDIMETEPHVRLLDLGGGTGAMADAVAAGWQEAVVVEPNRRKTRFGRRRRPHLTFVEARAERLPFPDAVFDCAIALRSFHHMENQGDALEEIRRVLKPSGRLVVEEFYPESEQGWLARCWLRRGGGHRLYEPAALAGKLGELGFRDVSVRPTKRSYYLHAVRI